MSDLSSPYKAFVRERCFLDENEWTSIDDLFGVWETWCENQRIRGVGTKDTFSKNLKAAIPELRSERASTGVRLRGYKGIKLKYNPYP